MTTFDLAFELLIGHEGAYVNDPDDRGGETNFGISKRSYPQVDIKALTLEDAKAIYRRDFWDRCRCGDLTPALAHIVFDAAVNNGAPRAARWLQQVAGVVADGAIGPKTLLALKTKNQAALAQSFMDLRVCLMMDDPNGAKYRKGWMRRLVKVSLQSSMFTA